MGMIIIPSAPVYGSHVKNCIIEAGKKFCEQQDMTRSDFGQIALWILCISLWFAAVVITEDLTDSAALGFLIFIAPFVIGAIWGLS